MKIIFIILFLFLSNISFGQVAVNASVHAVVIEPLTAYETSQMNFGKFSPQRMGGTLIMSPDGVLTQTGTVIITGPHNSASFLITGEYNATFSINLPNGPILLKSRNAKTMKVDDWKTNHIYGKLIGGEAVVKVGAVLTVGDMYSNPIGEYYGTYDITFSYN